TCINESAWMTTSENDGWSASISGVSTNSSQNEVMVVDLTRKDAELRGFSNAIKGSPFQVLSWERDCVPKAAVVPSCSWTARFLGADDEPSEEVCRKSGAVAAVAARS